MSQLDTFAIESEMPLPRGDALDVERMALACVLADVGVQRAAHRMADIITAEDFTVERHGVMWRAILAIMKRGEIPDGATLVDQLVAAGDAEATKLYVGELSTIDVAPALCEQYAHRVAERAYLRAITVTVREALTRTKRGGSPLEVASDMRAILARMPGGVRGVREDSMATGAEEAFDAIIAARDAAKRGHHRCAQWGVRALDGGRTRDDSYVEGALGGLFPGKLYILGGVPAAGKSTLAMQAALATARGGQGIAGMRVLYFSLEMLRVEIMKRLAGQMCGIPEARIERGALYPAEVEAIEIALNELSRLPIHIINTARTLEQIRARVLAERSRGDVGLVVIDYLQLIRLEAHYSDGNRMDEDRVQAAKDLAMEATVPVLAITAMTKAAQRDAADGKVDSTGAKGSGTAYAADLIAFLVRADPKDPSEQPKVIFAMTKRRGGVASNVLLRFDMPRGHFENGLDDD